jgi:hypothetical protein
MTMRNADIDEKSTLGSLLGGGCPTVINTHRSRRAGRELLISNIVFGVAFLFVTSIIFGLVG